MTASGYRRKSEARQLSGPRLASLQVPPQLLCGTAAWIWRGTGYLLFISEMPTPQHTQPTKNPNKVNPSSLDISRRIVSESGRRHEPRNRMGIGGIGEAQVDSYFSISRSPAPAGTNFNLEYVFSMASTLR